MEHFTWGESIVPLDVVFYIANELCGSLLFFLKAVMMQKAAILPCHTLAIIQWVV